MYRHAIDPPSLGGELDGLVEIINLVEDARTLAVILGAAGLIIGSLAGLYAGMIHARPDLIERFPLPFLTPGLAISCLLGGGLLYAAGRIGR